MRKEEVRDPVLARVVQIVRRGWSEACAEAELKPFDQVQKVRDFSAANLVVCCGKIESLYHIPLGPEC